MARKRNKGTATGDKTEVTADKATTSDAELAALTEMLDNPDAEIELDETPAKEATPVTGDTTPAKGSKGASVVSDNDLADDAAADIASEEAKGAAYADQESEVDISGDDSKTAKPGKKGGTPRVPKQSFEDAIKAMHAEEPLTFDAETGPLDDAAVDALIAGVHQVKVREKVVNLLQGVLKGGGISTYTQIALEVMKAAYLEGKPVTSADFRKAYEAKGYKSGTVGAQTGQMMVMFDALEMAKRIDRQTLEPNPNSVLLDALCS